MVGRIYSHHPRSGFPLKAKDTLPRKRPPRVVPLLAVLDVPVLDLHYGGVLALVERPAIDRIFLAALLAQNCPPKLVVCFRVERTTRTVEAQTAASKGIVDATVEAHRTWAV